MPKIISMPSIPPPAGSTTTWPATWTSTGSPWTSSTVRSSLSHLVSPTNRFVASSCVCFYVFEQQNYLLFYWMILSINSDPAEVDGRLPSQRQLQHLTRTVHLQGPADGLLQHRLLWHRIPGPDYEGKINFPENWSQKRSNIKLKIKIHFRCSISICIAKLLFLGEINSGHSISVFMMCLRNVKF